MAHRELLTPAQMAEVDRLAIGRDIERGYWLMCNAGAAVAAAAQTRFPAATGIHVLAGPGNNGGDGYVAARLLAEQGAKVTVWTEAKPHSDSDAALAAADWTGEVKPLSAFSCRSGDLIIDALFGAGLSRPLEQPAQAALDKARRIRGLNVLAVDLPSGLSGLTGKTLGAPLQADVTVTFFRKKPGHLLFPGRTLCGATIVADIGIDPTILNRVGLTVFENFPDVWTSHLPHLSVDAHKYSRGHVGVFSGGPLSTGAARLSAMAAARIGAGAVTVLSPPTALQVNGAHLTSIMLRRYDGFDSLDAFLKTRPSGAFVLGPGFGDIELLRSTALHILRTKHSPEDQARLVIGSMHDRLPVGALVLDADAFTAFAASPDDLFKAIADFPGAVVMTPHEGEFARLFPDIVARQACSKVEMATQAAQRSSATIIYKGPDTVIASPDGRAIINTNGLPLLATAGSGDVLAGITAGLLAQGMQSMFAAAAAVWLHADAANRFGPGLIAEDLPAQLPAVLSGLAQSLPAGPGLLQPFH